MRKFFGIKRIALLMALVFIFTFSTQGTLAYVVTKTPDFINTFVPGVRYLNSLIISKVVEHSLGHDYVIPEDINFQFQVELGVDYAGKTVTTTAGDYVADENGRITITVEPGSNVGILDLLEGTQVTVTELLVDGNGFAVKGGETTRVATIADGAMLNYVNLYTPAKVDFATVKVTGTKILEGRDWAEGDQFTFTLEQETADDRWTVLGSQTIKYDAANADFNRFDFAELIESIQFEKVGSYHFRMSEVIGNDDNMDYDETVNHFTVRVTDVDMDGKLEIDSVDGAQNVTVKRNETTGVYTVNVTFNNTFIAPVIPTPEDITLDVLVDKNMICTGGDTMTAEGFLFLLENMDNAELNAVLTSDAEGNAIHTLAFTAEDLGKTFRYRLTEVDDKKPGVTYSTAEYLIEITITLDEQNNRLKARITINDAASENILAVFENKYSDPGVSAPTGDTAQPMLLIAMMLLSGIGIVVILLDVIKRKKYVTDTDCY